MGAGDPEPRGVSLGVGSVAPRQLTRGKGQGPGRGSLSSPSPQHTGRWNWARRGLQGHTKKLGPAYILRHQGAKKGFRAR